MRDILKAIVDKKQQLANLKAVEMYTPEYIESQRQKYISEVKDLKDKYFTDLAKEKELKIEEIKKKYASKEKNYQEQLYKMERMKNKVQMMDKDTLKQFANNINMRDNSYSMEELEVIGAELNSKDPFAGATFADHFNDSNLDEPWKNDEEYQKVFNDYSNAICEIGQSTMILDNGNNTGTIVDIDDELK